MPVEIERITLVRLRKPQQGAGANELLQWFGRSLGLFGLRDRDKSCFRLFIELLKSSRGGKGEAKGEATGLSSDELAYRLRLTRGTVVHHLDTLMEAGLVVKSGSAYLLREDSLASLVDELREDLVRACDDLHAVAEEIDKAIRP